MADRFDLPEDVAAIFTSDPLEPEVEQQSSEVTEGPETAPPVKPEETQQPQPEEKVEVEAGKPSETEPVPEVADEPDEVALLREQLQTLQSQLAQAQAQPPKAEPPKTEEPNFQVNIPDQLLQLLESENPEDRRVAVSALAQGAAKIAYAESMKAMKAEMDRRMATIPQEFQQMTQVHQQVRDVFQDFYGTYPKLRDPRIMPVVGQVAQTVMQEMGSNWTPAVRDEIARRTFTRLGMVRQKAAAPAVMTQGSRPAPKQATPADREMDDIARTLDF